MIVECCVSSLGPVEARQLARQKPVGDNDASVHLAMNEYDNSTWITRFAFKRVSGCILPRQRSR